MSRQFSMQINVPRSMHGDSLSGPVKIFQWLHKFNLRASYVGNQSSGNGYTNGVSNEFSVYMVRNATEEDGVAFQLMFPDCSVYVCKQHKEYEKV